MRRLITAGVLMGIALFLSSCAMAPQAEIDAANVSIEAAKTAGADRYAPESLNAASEALKTAITAVEEQNAKFALFRNYDAANTTLASVSTLATKAVDETTAKKASLKAEVNQAITDLNALIVADKELLAKAPKGKEGKAALEAVGQETAVVETESTSVTASLANNEDILTLSEKIKPAIEKAKAINTELTEVIAKVNGKGNSDSEIINGKPSSSLDTDSDGVPDNIDRCPKIPGSRANYGCPSVNSSSNVPQDTTVKRAAFGVSYDNIIPMEETGDLRVVVLIDGSKAIIKSIIRKIEEEEHQFVIADINTSTLCVIDSM